MTDEQEQNIDIFDLDGKQVVLVGTAHVSKTSADLVTETIAKYQPDTVCLELDEGRFDSLRNPERWKETDIYEIVKSGKSYVLLAQLALAGFQKKIASQFGINPGQEMIAGIKCADECKANISLIDRDVRTTLKRAWGNAGPFSVFRILVSMVFSVFSNEEMSEKEIEDLKESDALSAMMSEFEEFLPGVKEVLIDERDLYMSEKIRLAPGKNIVAVVGAGHVPGMKKHLGNEIDIAPLEEIPPPSPWVRVIKFGIPTLVVGMVLVGFFKYGSETGTEMIISWFLANGILAALGTIIARAHILTVLAAFFAAPLTSLNPTIAAGWVCGLVEAVIRKPRVKDLESVGDDATTVSGFWKNRVSRILLIAAFANIGSMLGTAVGAGLIARLLNA